MATDASMQAVGIQEFSVEHVVRVSWLPHLQIRKPDNELAIGYMYFENN